MGSHIFLLSRKREVKVAHSTNKTTRCRNCQRYGHTAPVASMTTLSALSALSTTGKRNTAAPTPPAPKKATSAPSPTAAPPPLPTAPTVGTTTQPLTPPARPAPDGPKMLPPLPPRPRTSHPQKKGRWTRRRTRPTYPRPPALLPLPRLAVCSPPLRSSPHALSAPRLPHLSYALLQALPAHFPRWPPALLLPRQTIQAWPINVAHPTLLSPGAFRRGRSFSFHRTTQQPWELGRVPLSHE